MSVIRPLLAKQNLGCYLCGSAAGRRIPRRGSRALRARRRAERTAGGLRELVAGWPAVAAAKSGDEALAKFLSDAASDEPFEAWFGAPEIGGRFGYNEKFDGFNHERRLATVEQLLDLLLRQRGHDAPFSMYAGGIPIRKHLPALLPAIPMPLLDAKREMLISLWLGNRTRTAAHWDLPQNLACVVAGRRKFSFPTDHLNRVSLDHRFCSNCGVQPFCRGKGPDGRPMAMVNLRCVRGVDVNALEIVEFDGASLYRSTFVRIAYSPAECLRFHFPRCTQPTPASGSPIAARDAREASRGEAIARAAETPHIILNAPLVGQRLGYPDLSGLDLLELFAFIHPARFAVPTVAGMCRARRDCAAGKARRRPRARSRPSPVPCWPTSNNRIGQSARAPGHRASRWREWAGAGLR